MPELPRVNPFGNLSSWHGSVETADGTNTSIFTENDLDKVLASGETSPNDWDGECAAIVRLKDGRYVSWETSWGPTGDGFCEDAYGGDATLHFSSTFENAVKFGLSPSGRKLCGLADVAEP